MTITALPTTYKGTRFRSRLEADWAATLDSLDIAWIYEPEGYKLPSGACYSPDFWLPDMRVWLEVKGSHNQRIDLVREFDAALWAESGCTDRSQPDAPIVLVGREPRDSPLDGSRTWMSLNGSHYSAWLVRCRACTKITAFVPGSITCRCCRTRGTVTHDFSEMISPFIYVPRPAGRG